MDEITPLRSQKGSCEYWPLLESQISVAERKFGIWLKTGNHRVSVSKDSCKRRFSYTMQLDHCQPAMVLFERGQDDVDIDKKQRTFQGFQLA